jgi:hypothetical protein
VGVARQQVRDIDGEHSPPDMTLVSTGVIVKRAGVP